MLTQRPSTTQQFAEDSARVVRAEYLKPLIMVAIGTGLACIAAFQSDGAVFYMGSFVIALAITVVVAFLGLTIASVLFSLDAGPVSLVFLRLAGIYAILLPVNGLLPFGGLLWGISMLMILAGMIALLFDFDMQEATIVVVIMILVNLAANIALLALFN